MSFSITPVSTSVTEGGSLTFTVTRSSSVGSQTVYVSTTTTEGFSNNSDYNGILNQVLTFNAGQTSKTVTVSTTNDSTIETNETFGIIVQQNSSDPVGTYLDKSTFTILNDDNTGWSISPGSTTVNETSGVISFTITRPSGPAQTLYVSTTQDQGSINSGDYLGKLNEEITFASGQTERIVDVQILNDGNVESDETFGLIVQQSPDDPINVNLVSSTFTIESDDLSPPPSEDLPTAIELFDENGFAGFLARMSLAAYRDQLGGLDDGENTGSVLTEYNYADGKLQLFDASDLMPLTGGTLIGGTFVNQNAAALVGRTADALFISFRGTNDAPDPGLLDHIAIINGGGTSDQDHWYDNDDAGIDEGMLDHYQLLTPIIEAVLKYAETNSLSKIFVTGHSLGAAMVQKLFSLFPEDDRFEAVTFGSPGFQGLADDPTDSRIVNVKFNADPVAFAGAIADLVDNYGNRGSDLSIVPPTFNAGIYLLSSVFSPAWFAGLPGFFVHSMKAYQAVSTLINDGTIGGGVLRVSLSEEGDTWVARRPTGLIEAFDLIGNIIRSGNGNDTLNGSVFDDILDAGNGSDDIFGRLGFDWLKAGSGAGNDYYDGGGDVDTIDYSSTLLGVVVNLSLSSDHAFGPEIDTDQIINVENVVGGKGSDQITGDGFANLLIGGDGADTLDGGLGNDSLYGGEGKDLLIGRGGNDTLRGEGGNDQLFTGFGDDRGEGGAGNDLIKTGPGKDTLLGGSGDDTLGASNRSDLLRGEAGNDLMLGSNGNDRLFGGDGNDTMLGGNGRDTLQGDAGADRLVGGGNTDTASYADAGAGVQVRLWAGDGTKGEATGDQLIDMENLIGSGFNDTLTGDDSANRIDGKLGNDIIQGLGGADQLIGGRGADTITGGAGDDTFLYFNGDGADTITDFTAGAGTDDLIRLFALGSAFDSFAEVIAASSDNGADTTIDFGGGNSITLQGVTVGDLHQDDFMFG